MMMLGMLGVLIVPPPNPGTMITWPQACVFIVVHGGLQIALFLKLRREIRRTGDDNESCNI